MERECFVNSSQMGCYCICGWKNPYNGFVNLSSCFCNHPDWRPHVVRRQRGQVQLQLQCAGNLQRQREAKLAKNISFLVGVYLILNFPVMFVLIYDQLFRVRFHYNHYSWTETLAFLNSCTNPLICCWKNKEVRRKVKNILKKLVVYK